MSAPDSLRIPITIETNALTKSFKSYKKPEGLKQSFKSFLKREYIERTALKPTSLSISEGQIVGLVGANGAGKTTLLKLLSGLIYPSGGTAHVLGFTPWERDFKYLRQISILLGQKNQLWWDISPLDSFALLSKIYDLDSATAQKRVLSLANTLDCTHVLETQLRRLSLGERMKMELIGALLHSPKILFLDEPTIGLDVVAQENIREFISNYSKQYAPTIILTSHYMDDIAQLASQLLLIQQGSIVYTGTVKDFTRKSSIRKKIIFSLNQGLQEDLDLGFGLLAPANKTEIEFAIESEQMGVVLSKMTAVAQIKNIEIKEVDFEEVIKEFLETKSRIF